MKLGGTHPEYQETTLVGTGCGRHSRPRAGLEDKQGSKNPNLNSKKRTIENG